MGGQRKSKVNLGKQTKLSANIRKKIYLLCDSWEAQTNCLLEEHILLP